MNYKLILTYKLILSLRYIYLFKALQIQIRGDDIPLTEVYNTPQDPQLKPISLNFFWM